MSHDIIWCPTGQASVDAIVQKSNGSLHPEAGKTEAQRQAIPPRRQTAHRTSCSRLVRELKLCAPGASIEMVYHWDGKEAECYRLYVEEKKSLDEVIAYWEARDFTPRYISITVLRPPKVTEANRVSQQTRFPDTIQEMGLSQQTESRAQKPCDHRSPAAAMGAKLHPEGDGRDSPERRPPDQRSRADQTSFEA